MEAQAEASIDIVASSRQSVRAVRDDEALGGGWLKWRISTRGTFNVHMLRDSLTSSAFRSRG